MSSKESSALPSPSVAPCTIVRRLSSRRLSSRLSWIAKMTTSEPLARSVKRYRKPATYRFIPQHCWFCENLLTVYRTRSGLLDHVTFHHGHWYSSRGDVFVPVPSADLQQKCAQCRMDRCTGTAIMTQLALTMLAGLGPSILLDKITWWGTIAINLAYRIRFFRPTKMEIACPMACGTLQSGFCHLGSNWSHHLRLCSDARRCWSSGHAISCVCLAGWLPLLYRCSSCNCAGRRASRTGKPVLEID